MITFEFAKQEHLAEIVSTYNASIPGKLATADLSYVTLESKQKWFDEHTDEKRPLWVISYNNNYAGWMSFSNFYGRPAYDITAELSIYLEPEMQGKGIGKTALQFAEKEATKRNISTLLAFIFGHNETSLYLFYKQHYQKWGNLPQVANIDGVLRDLVIVGKKIH